MADYLNFLGQCVTATEESVTTIEACITNLQPGVGDLPRLNKVLANEHVSHSRSRDTGHTLTGLSL